MSEYQYYEFQTIGRKLSESELTQIRKLSSRVKPTSSCAIFTYSYSDFPSDPKKIIAKYFDAMLYVANWGTKQLSFRLPVNLVDKKSLLQYCCNDVISLEKVGNYYILSLCIEEEDGFGWVDAEDVLDGLLPLRDAVLNGDYRVLYLTWLKALGTEFLEHDDVEPPIPLFPNELSLPLTQYVKFMGINEKLIKIACSNNKVKQKGEIKLEKYIKELSEKDKISFLRGILRDEPCLQFKLRKKLQKFHPVKMEKSKAKKRTVAELLDELDYL